MSVSTAAEERIAEAKEHIEKAYASLHKASDPEGWGYSDLSFDKLQELHTIEIELLKIKSKL